MRLLDHDEPIDPEVAASLDAIDATLAGEPVGAEYAELAEIALLLTSVRPEVPPAFAQSMDQRVARRFVSTQAAAPAKREERRRRLVVLGEGVGALTAAVAVVVALLVFVGHGQSGSSVSSSSSAAFSASTTSAAGSSAAGSSAAHSSAAPTASAGHGVVRAPKPAPPKRSGTLSTAPALVPPTGAGSSSSPAGAPTLQPPTSGRHVVQSAQLSLGVAPDRIDDVAQEVYDVIGALGGVVENSSVTQTGGSDGYADFQLSVPSASLGQAMSRLSSLNYASVLSRTDASQDITDQYNAATRRLADARALRTSLLKQLANATTTEQIDSIKAQIHDAEASISSDQATLNRLNRQVNFSQLALTINARRVPVPVSHGDGGFTVGRAAHDAGRVLTVAAGVSLIAIAALTPVGLVVALVWWVGAALRRRRREHALDSA
jgi:hypothetical protein